MEYKRYYLLLCRTTGKTLGGAHLTPTEAFHRNEEFELEGQEVIYVLQSEVAECRKHTA